MIMIGDSKASEVQLIDDVIYETLGLLNDKIQPSKQVNQIETQPEEGKLLEVGPRSIKSTQM